MKFSYRNIKHSILFILAVVLLSLFYDYVKVADFGPISLHRWRQADGASMARCYYEEGMRFLQPRVHHMLNGDPAAVSEFPIMYYLAAGFYHLFGPEDVILRLLDFLSLTLGLFLVSRLLLELSGHMIFSLSMPLLLFGSPIVAFYGFNFLPNPVGLGFSLGAFYFYYRMIKDDQKRWYFPTTLFFLLGALIKITTLIPFIALLGVAFFSYLLPGWRKNYAQYFPPVSRLAIMTFLILGLTIAWYGWAKYYNEAHRSGLLTTSFKPIWDMTAESILFTYDQIRQFYHTLYFHPYTLVAFGLTSIINLFLFRFIPKEIYLFYIFNLLGAAFFLLLFYDQILVHHYYIIDLMSLFLLVFTLFFWTIGRWRTKIFHSWAFGLLLVGLVIFNWQNVRENHMIPYYKPEHPSVSPVNPSLQKREALALFKKEKGLVFGEDEVVCAPDVTPNNLLYYLNLRGWSEFGAQPLTDERIRQFVRQGADYLVLSDTAYISKLPESTRDLFGVFDDSVFFYDLRRFKE